MGKLFVEAPDASPRLNCLLLKTSRYMHKLAACRLARLALELYEKVATVYERKLNVLERRERRY